MGDIETKSFNERIVLSFDKKRYEKALKDLSSLCTVFNGALDKCYEKGVVDKSDVTLNTIYGIMNEDYSLFKNAIEKKNT